MDFRESISGELPAPRDDEPAGLRQDILDELADHLACSFHREILRGVQPEEARRRAIERFGSPAAVARRLWLDAMKGKIMAQRFWIATSLIVTTACVGLTGLAWSQSKRIAAEQAEANRRLAEALDQSRTANEAILRRLEAVAKASSKSSVWVPIKLRLTLEKPDGPPAVGYKVHLGRGIGGALGPSQMKRITDDSGLADFGVVQPGDWEFHVQAYPWTLTQSVNVLPDTPVDRTIACPMKGQAPVKVRVDWPKSLVEKDLVAVAVFRHQGVKVGPFAWDSNFLYFPRGCIRHAARLSSLSAVA